MLECLVIWVISVKGQIVLKFKHLRLSNIKKTLGHNHSAKAVCVPDIILNALQTLMQ